MCTDAEIKVSGANQKPVSADSIPEVVVQVESDGSVGLSDGYSCAEISRYLEETEGGGGGGGRGGGELILCWASAQVGGEVNTGQ